MVTQHVSGVKWCIPLRTIVEGIQTRQMDALASSLPPLREDWDYHCTGVHGVLLPLVLELMYVSNLKETSTLAMQFAVMLG